jgi:hypothetical protein
MEITHNLSVLLTSAPDSEQGILHLSQATLQINAHTVSVSIPLQFFLGLDVQKHPDSHLTRAVVIYVTHSGRRMRIKQLPVFCKDFQQLQSFREKLPLKRETWLVFVNPASGNGRGLEVYREALKILLPAGIKIERIETRWESEAYSAVRNMPLERLRRYDAVVCCSGDGTVHEVINGFCKREDRGSTELRVGGIPAGSACSLIFNALHRRGLDLTLENALYLLLKGERREMGLMRYKLMPANRDGRSSLTSLLFHRPARRLPR